MPRTSGRLTCIHRAYNVGPMKLVYVSNPARQCPRCKRQLMRCVGFHGATAHPIVCWICVTERFPCSIDWQVAYFEAAEEVVSPRKPWLPSQTYGSDVPF